MSYVRKSPDHYIGRRFGKIVVKSLDHIEEGSSYPYFFKCECDCGKLLVLRQTVLNSNLVGCEDCRKENVKGLHRKYYEESINRKPRKHGNEKWLAIPVKPDMTLYELEKALPASSSGMD